MMRSSVACEIHNYFVLKLWNKLSHHVAMLSGEMRESDCRFLNINQLFISILIILRSKRIDIMDYYNGEVYHCE